MWLWESSNTALSFQWLLDYWFSLWMQALSFQGSCGPRELGIGLGQVETPQSSLFLSALNHFSWLNNYGIVNSLLLISRVLKEMILTIFASVLIAFIQEKISRGTYSSIFTAVSPSLNFMWLVQVTIIIIIRVALEAKVI